MSVAAKAISDLVVKDASFLINFDDRCSCVIPDYARFKIALVQSSLLQRIVTGIFTRQRRLMPDRDMRVDHGILGTDSNHATRIVSFRDLIELEASRSRLVVLIAHAIVLFIPVQHTFSIGLRIGLTSSNIDLIVTLSLALKVFQFTNGVTVTVSLAVIVLVLLGMY